MNSIKKLVLLTLILNYNSKIFSLDEDITLDDLSQPILELSDDELNLQSENNAKKIESLQKNLENEALMSSTNVGNQIEVPKELRDALDLQDRISKEQSRRQETSPSAPPEDQGVPKRKLSLEEALQALQDKHNLSESELLRIKGRNPKNNSDLNNALQKILQARNIVNYDDLSIYTKNDNMTKDSKKRPSEISVEATSPRESKSPRNSPRIRFIQSNEFAQPSESVARRLQTRRGS